MATQTHKRQLPAGPWAGKPKAPSKAAPKKKVPGNSNAGTETAKRATNGMAMEKAAPSVKKAVKKTATAAKKTVKRAVSAVKKAVKKRSATAGGGRAAEAGRKSWYT